MRILDQVGSSLFNDNPEYLEGLRNELLAGYNPSESILEPFLNPYFFINFARLRFDKVVTIPGDRKKYYYLWQKAEPPIDVTIPSFPCPATHIAFRGRQYYLTDIPSSS